MLCGNSASKIPRRNLNNQITVISCYLLWNTNLVERGRIGLV